MTASLYGRPTAAELVAAVAEFLETDVRQSTSGQVNFHSRVAANALRIVQRELSAGDQPGEVSGLLRELGYRDEAELAAAIRAGEVDGADERVRDAMRALVVLRLAAAHPGYQDA